MRDNSNIELCRGLCQSFPAGPNTFNKTNSLPLHFASKRWRPNKDLLRLLLKRNPGGAAVVNEFGFLPLHCACASTDDIDAVKMIYDAYPEAISIKDRQVNKSHILHLSSSSLSSSIFDISFEPITSFFHDSSFFSLCFSHLFYFSLRSVARNYIFDFFATFLPSIMLSSFFLLLSYLPFFLIPDLYSFLSFYLPSFLPYLLPSYLPFSLSSFLPSFLPLLLPFFLFFFPALFLLSFFHCIPPYYFSYYLAPFLHSLLLPFFSIFYPSYLFSYLFPLLSFFLLSLVCVLTYLLTYFLFTIFFFCFRFSIYIILHLIVIFQFLDLIFLLSEIIPLAIYTFTFILNLPRLLFLLLLHYLIKGKTCLHLAVLAVGQDHEQAIIR